MVGARLPATGLVTPRQQRFPPHALREADVGSRHDVAAAGHVLSTWPQPSALLLSSPRVAINRRRYQPAGPPTAGPLAGRSGSPSVGACPLGAGTLAPECCGRAGGRRSEEHTSELQSR